MAKASQTANESNEGTSAPAASASGSNLQFAAIDTGPSSGRSDSRSIMLEVPMADNTKRTMARADYIRARFEQDATRGQIKKEVEQLQGKPVQYQVIFAATRGMTNKHTKPKGAGGSKADVGSEGSE